MPLSPAPIETPRLQLIPVSRELAGAILAGDLSSVAAGSGWPHDGTLDGLRMALRHGHAPGWFVTLQGVVIGDCGVHGEPDEQGEVEIGFGLAAPYRGRGLGGELVAALSRWLLGQVEVTGLRARVEPANTPSQKVLAKAGFTRRSAHDDYLTYVLAPGPRADGGASA
jgi:RimJ/RimL family protein N-acetyltransferase